MVLFAAFKYPKRHFMSLLMQFRVKTRIYRPEMRKIGIVFPSRASGSQRNFILFVRKMILLTEKVIFLAVSGKNGRFFGPFWQKFCVFCQKSHFSYQKSDFFYRKSHFIYRKSHFFYQKSNFSIKNFLIIFMKNMSELRKR